MKPLLALVSDQRVALDADYAADLINRALDREFGNELVHVALLTTPEDLRGYEAGDLILYRKPAHRRRGDKIVYNRDGTEVHLEQSRLPLE